MKQKIFLVSLFVIAAFCIFWITQRTVSQPQPVKLAVDTQSAQVSEAQQPSSSTGKIEVIEFFWYGCPHCYALEPYLEKWLATKPDDVVFRRVPGILGENWIPHARAYFTAEKLGVVERIHKPLFDAIHQDKKSIMNEDDLRNFFVGSGVAKDDFDRIYQSQEITDKVKAAFAMGQSFQLSGVPTLLVNAKYLVSPSSAGGYAETVTAVNKLVEAERATTTPY
jgi:thiol:disulfide interchange protein DsbA